MQAGTSLRLPFLARRTLRKEARSICQHRDDDDDDDAKQSITQSLCVVHSFFFLLFLFFFTPVTALVRHKEKDEKKKKRKNPFLFFSFCRLLLAERSRGGEWLLFSFCPWNHKDKSGVWGVGRRWRWRCLLFSRWCDYLTRAPLFQLMRHRSCVHVICLVCFPSSSAVLKFFIISFTNSSSWLFIVIVNDVPYSWLFWRKKRKRKRKRNYRLLLFQSLQSLVVGLGSFELWPEADYQSVVQTRPYREGLIQISLFPTSSSFWDS